MGDYVNQAGEGKNFSPAELEQAGQQFDRLPGIEYVYTQTRHQAIGLHGRSVYGDPWWRKVDLPFEDPGVPEGYEK